MSLQIKFFQVGCGDAIAIRFLGNDGSFHNILVDGGIEDYYEECFKPEIEAIYERGEKIDLWIISHIHDDHIGGVVQFIEDEALQTKIDVKEIKFWFNYTYIDIPVSPQVSAKVSFSQAKSLRGFLMENSLLNESNTNAKTEVLFEKAKITVLSPNQEKFEILEKKWHEKEREIIKKETSERVTSGNDYKKSISELLSGSFQKDNCPFNGSSIAFLFEFESKKILFSADSHPDIIKESLQKLGYSEENKIVLDYMQLSHHGSKYNTSADLLALIDCEDFIISADGYSRKPYKETLVRIMENNRLQDKQTNFIFNHDEDILKDIFKTDTKEILTTYNLNCNFDLIQNNALVITQ